MSAISWLSIRLPCCRLSEERLYGRQSLGPRPNGQAEQSVLSARRVLTDRPKGRQCLAVGVQTRVHPRGQAQEVQFDTLFHVCGDKTVRLPEVLIALSLHLQPSDFVDQARALVWAATSQASFIGDIGTKLSAGLANLEPTFWGTPYQGCYGPTFDSGVSAPGLLCRWRVPLTPACVCACATPPRPRFGTGGPT